MGTFGPGRWAVFHAGDEIVLNEGLPTKSSSWNNRKPNTNAVNTMPNNSKLSGRWLVLLFLDEGLTKDGQRLLRWFSLFIRRKLSIVSRCAMFKRSSQTDTLVITAFAFYAAGAPAKRAWAACLVGTSRIWQDVTLPV